MPCPVFSCPAIFHVLHFQSTHNRHYGPGYAVLCCAGEDAERVQWVMADKYFSSYQSVKISASETKKAPHFEVENLVFWGRDA